MYLNVLLIFLLFSYRKLCSICTGKPFLPGGPAIPCKKIEISGKEKQQNWWKRLKTITYTRRCVCSMYVRTYCTDRIVINKFQHRNGEKLR